MNDNNTTPPSAPSNANTGCVGPQSETAGKASACEGCPNQSACSSGTMRTPEAMAQAQAQTQALQASLSNVSHVILVLSGKGGVGKSTIASQLCHTLSQQGYAVGLLDVDLCGPSAPRMILGDACTSATIHQSNGGSTWTPVYSPNNPNLALMSIGFLLQDPNQAVVWRGPRKNQLIQQFFTNVDWSGDTNGLDYLIVDTPPGTSDEHISTVQFLQQANAVSGAIVVTTPEEISLADVRKELNFCLKTKVSVLGIIENMSSYQTSFDQLMYTDSHGNDCSTQVLKTLQETCPELLQLTITAPLFAPTTTASTSKSGAEQMAIDHNVEYWGTMPMDRNLLQACEHGHGLVTQYPNSLASKALQELAKKLVTKLPVTMMSN